MLARFQRRILFALLILIVSWSGFFAWLRRPWWSLAIFALVGVGYVAALGLEFVAVAAARGGSPSARSHGGALLRAWWREIMAAPPVFCWRQPFRANAEPDCLTGARGRRGVILVHGLVCNRGFWNPWIRRLKGHGTPFVAVNLEPLFGSIDAYAAVIDAAVRALQDATGLPVVLVGHSMGGLAIRAWLRESNADARVHRVVTIGTPHRGTWLARTGRTVNSRQMRIDSPWLIALAADEPAHRSARFSCCYSDCDNIVFPAHRATLPGASNLLVTGAAHVQLAFVPAVFEEVRRWLDTSEPASANTGTGQ